MLGMVMGKLLEKAVQEVRKRNQSNPEVKTAESSVFGNILERFNQKKQQADDPADTSYTPAAEEFCDDLCNEVDEMQHQNAADPNVETADSSVFTDMKAQIEALKKQIAEQEKAPSINNIPTPDLASLGSSIATTSSNAGSLGFRTEPNMGSPMRQVRIPDNSRLKVLGYSENKIILDGKESRFAKVEFQGELGWVLESYLKM